MFHLWISGRKKADLSVASKIHTWPGLQLETNKEHMLYPCFFRCNNLLYLSSPPEADRMFKQDTTNEFQQMIDTVYKETSRHLLDVLHNKYKFMDHLKVRLTWVLCILLCLKENYTSINWHPPKNASYLCSSFDFAK